MDGSYKQHPASGIAFSISRRSCVGELLARGAIFLFLTQALNQFTFFPPDDRHAFDSTLSEEGFVRGIHGFQVKAVPVE